MKIPGVDDQSKSATFIINDQGGPDLAGPSGPGAQVEGIMSRPFDITAAQNRLAEFEAKVLELKAVAIKFEIVDDQSFVRLAEMTGQAKQLDKNIGRAAEAFYIDAYNYYKSVLNIKNSITNITAEIARILKQKSNEYAYKKELDRREAEKKARAEAAKVQAKLDAQAKKKGVAPITMAPAPVIPKDTGPLKTQSGTMSTKMVWTFELEDLTSKAVFDLVLRTTPAKYREVAEAALKKAVKSGVHEKVEGVRFFERAETTHRAR